MYFKIFEIFGRMSFGVLPNFRFGVLMQVSVGLISVGLPSVGQSGMERTGTSHRKDLTRRPDLMNVMLV